MLTNRSREWHREWHSSDGVDCKLIYNYIISFLSSIKSYRNDHFVAKPIVEEHHEKSSQQIAHEEWEIWQFRAVLAEVINVNAKAK